MVTVEYASNEKLMDLVDEARANNNFKGNLRFEQSNDFMSNIFWNFFPLLFIIAIWVFIMRRMGGGSPTGGSVFNVGKSKAKLIEKGEATRVTFKDVAGQAGAKMEVEEIVDAQWRDLGMPETLWHCRVKEFGPLIVSIDTEGRNLFLSLIHI